MSHNDTFVKLCENSRIDIKMMYPLLGMKTAVDECFLRKAVYQALQKASERLPCGYRLRIWDAWRPLELHKELYEVYRQSVIDTFNLSSLSENEQNTVISKYIAIPSENPDLPPAHTTGGAIDLTLIDENGNELDMGTDFDDFSEKAATDYFEKKEFDGSTVQKNRRILKSAMTSAGFTNLASEWWHYDYGNSFKGVFKIEELIIE